MPGTNFHENVTSQTQIININASLWYSKMTSFRKNEGILVPICNFYILVTIQVTRLKFGSFPYLWLFSLPIFMVFWKRGFQAPVYCPCLMWNFPVHNRIVNRNMGNMAFFLISSIVLGLLDQLQIIQLYLIELLGLLTDLGLLELWHLIYPRLLTGFGMLVFFTNSSLMEY